MTASWIYCAHIALISTGLLRMCTASWYPCDCNQKDLTKRLNLKNSFHLNKDSAMLKPFAHKQSHPIHQNY